MGTSLQFGEHMMDTLQRYANALLALYRRMVKESFDYFDIFWSDFLFSIRIYAYSWQRQMIT